MSNDTEMRVAAPARVGDSSYAVRPHTGIFRKEGEYWSVGLDGNDFRLKDSKGLAYLAYLLRHPGTEFHALDLASGIAAHPRDDEIEQSIRELPAGGSLENAGMHITNLGDAGEMLDEQAKTAYRRRLSELRKELEETKQLHKSDRVEQIEDEIASLTRELSRAVGLRGRNRRAASASERARQSITKTIKSVVARIAETNRELADVLSRSVKTGYFCAYQPDPSFPIVWHFAEMAIASPGQSGATKSAPSASDDSHSLSAVSEAPPFSFAEGTAFVGRETERDVIRTAIDRARTGRGSIIMLRGEPGVGKTRLAWEMAEYASGRGFSCYVGRCYERDEPFPYLPFVEIIESRLAKAPSLKQFRNELGENAPELAKIFPRLRRIFPNIPPLPELMPAQQRRHIFQGISELLERAAHRRPQLNILEDLQWADESSLALLIHLANRIIHLPIVIVGTYRSEDSERNGALVRTLEELIRMGVRPLKLTGLSENDVAQMLAALSKSHVPDTLVHLIFEESHGNPFFVEEVYRHLLEEGRIFDAAGRFRTNIEIDEIDVPENLRLIINRRLQRLDDRQKRVLAVAAVIGRSFSFQLLAAVSQLNVDELFNIVETAQRMGIMIPSSHGPEKPLAFTHELVRQTLLEGISIPRRQQLHASVADAIERLDPASASEHAGEIADHLLKAGPFADRLILVHWLELAGTNALEAAAFNEAERSFRRALSYQEAITEEKKAELLGHLAMSERGLERWDDAINSLTGALEIYIQLQDRSRIGRNFSELADTLIWAGRFQKAAETARRGLAYLRSEITHDRARLLAASVHASTASAGFEPDIQAVQEGLDVAFQLPPETYEAAQEALREALNIASQLRDSKLEARLLGAKSALNFQFFRLREAVADGLLCEKLDASASPPSQRIVQLRVLHQALVYLGRLEEALRIADQLEDVAKKSGQLYSFEVCRSSRAWIEFARAPDLARLESDFQQVSRSDQREKFVFLDVLSEVQLCLAQFFRGNWTRALQHAQASRRDSRRFFGGLGVGMLFRMMAYLGDRDGALKRLDEWSWWLPIAGGPNTRSSWWMLALVIEGLVMLGERLRAGELYPLACELINTGAVALWPIARFTQTIAGMAAAAGGLWDSAQHHFQMAFEQAERFPNRLECAEIKRFEAMMLLERGTASDYTTARNLLSDALLIYRQIGMPRHIEMVEKLLLRAPGG